MNADIYFLAEQLGAVLSASGQTVTTAESCTGGGISYAITEVAGSSAWFEAAFICYSNRIKTAQLNVAPELLAAHGAVSEAVVAAMAQGALAQASADLAVAVSGIAGPGGGSADKPVGTVCIALASAERSLAHTWQFPGNRQAVREQTVQRALELLLQHCRP